MARVCPAPAPAGTLGQTAVVATVAFLHAHPDDEAIFTGATMARLAAAGHRVVLVVATDGRLGSPAADPLTAPEGDAPPAGVRPAPWAVHPLDHPGDDVARHRRDETRRAAALLGVAAVEVLRFRDSGMAGDPANHDPDSLWTAGAGAAAEAALPALAAEQVDVVVTYDPGGIYGHPDHVRVAELGWELARALDVPTVYEATVDREHLHFVETHLVEEAALAGDLGLVRSRLGTPTVEITTVVTAGAALDTKRAAMAAHRSQIPPDSAVLALPDDRFGATYGLEWYVRHGPPGPLDELG